LLAEFIQVLIIELLEAALVRGDRVLALLDIQSFEHSASQQCLKMSRCLVTLGDQVEQSFEVRGLQEVREVVVEEGSEQGRIVVQH
jgi:hypothetical protein